MLDLSVRNKIHKLALSLENIMKVSPKSIKLVDPGQYYEVLTGISQTETLVCGPSDSEVYTTRPKFQIFPKIPNV